MSDQTKSTRIAIPSELPGGLEARRSGHFGRCECFTLVDVENGAVGQVTVLTNAPHTEGGCMAPVMALAEHMVDAIVVDGIGGRPLIGCHQVGIAVHAGVARTSRPRSRPTFRAVCPSSGSRAPASTHPRRPSPGMGGGSRHDEAPDTGSADQRRSALSHHRLVATTTTW